MNNHISYDSIPEGFSASDNIEIQINKAISHNSKIRAYYFDRIKEFDDVISSVIEDVFSPSNSLEKNYLILRQLVQIKGIYTFAMNHDVDLGCTINHDDNGIQKVFDKMVYELRKKLKTIDSFIKIVEENIKKSPSTSLKNLHSNLFDSDLLSRLHKAFNGRLFNNSFEDFVTALSNPGNNDYRLNLLDSADRTYAFLYYLQSQCSEKTFDIMMCVKQNLKYDTYKKKRTSVKHSTAKKDIEFTSIMNKCLMGIKRK